MKFAASFSGGKDSTLAIKRMLDEGKEVVALIVSTKRVKTSLGHTIWIKNTFKR